MASVQGTFVSAKIETLVIPQADAAIRSYIHRFDKGDGIKVHNHQTGGNHQTIVTKGSFVVHGEREGLVINPGDILCWRPDEWHGFEALVDGSELVNVRIAVIPGKKRDHDD